MKQKIRILFTIVLMASLLTFSAQASQAADYSGLTWTQAFDQMYQQLTREYAFTEWKQIDWNSLYSQYAPKILAAQQVDDFTEYYIALREFLTEIPDGHVSVNNLPEIDNLYVGGGFGFSASRLSNGSLIAAWVDGFGPAYASGMRTGAVLTAWNGEPVADALAHVSTIYAGPSATTENLELKQAQYLTRAPVGTEVEVAFVNSGDAAPKTVTLTAFDDGGSSLSKSYPSSVLSDKIRSMYLGLDDPNPVPNAMVETKTLENNIMYIKIWGELDADLQGTGTAPSTLSEFQAAVQQAVDQKAAAMIVDIRNNLGGFDEMSAAILGSFYGERTLYEQLSMYDEKTGQFLRPETESESGTLYIEPVQPCSYSGLVLCLINQKCVSSGEGIAMGIRNLPNGATIGFYGTSGSFGLAGAEIAMPGGLTVHYPYGQSLDADGQIQIDSRNGIGGISPSIRVEMTEESATRVASGVDVELEAAINYIEAQTSDSL